MTPADGTFRADYQADPRLRQLLGPGGPFEVRDVVVDGVALRSFVRAPATIVDCFQAARSHAGLVHLVFEDARLTFGDVRRQALSVARRLRADFGIRPGDRVAIAMRNFPEVGISFWAAAAAGAIPVLLNAWWMGPELRYALADAGAGVVFADAERIERLAGPGDGQQAPPVIGVRAGPGGTDPAGGIPGPGVAAFEDLAGGPPLDEAELPVPGLDEVAVILYTSGTT